MLGTRFHSVKRLAEAFDERDQRNRATRIAAVQLVIVADEQTDRRAAGRTGLHDSVDARFGDAADGQNWDIDRSRDRRETVAAQQSGTRLRGR